MSEIERHGVKERVRWGNGGKCWKMGMGGGVARKRELGPLNNPMCHGCEPCWLDYGQCKLLLHWKQK